MTIIKKILNFIFKHKIIIGINYHRIGYRSLNDPFKELHSISFINFKIQIILIKFFFKILSLEEIYSGNLNNKINFFITFDDVPSDSVIAFNWLCRHKIPFTICPNISIIENKNTIGDKVRFIVKFLQKNEIEEKFKNLLSNNEFSLLKKLGLKKFYKSFEINQLNFKTIFNDFFKNFEKEFEKFNKNKNYLDWAEISNLSKISSIASHGNNHDNFFYLDSDKIYNEMSSSKEIFYSKIKKNIQIFTVPYGEYNQNLGVMSNMAARKLGYKQILWVGNQAIIYSGKHEHQIQNLFRINAPSNFFIFLKTIVYSFMNSSIILKDNKNFNFFYEKRYKNFSLKKNILQDEIAAFENTVRPNKDYSSDEEFIKKVYIDNPFRGEKPHNFSISRNGVTNSIHYNLYKKYLINKTSYTVLESSGWRKLNSLSVIENSRLLLNALKTCEIIYSWRPSKFLSIGYKKSGNFFTINNTEYFLKPDKYDFINKDEIMISDICPENITPFLENFNKKFYFSLERSVKFYKWRVDDYPLGKQKYFTKKINNQTSSLLVSQILNKKALIVDLLSNDLNESILMLKFFLDYCLKNEIVNVKFSTSNKSLIKKMSNNFKCKYENFNSFIYIKNLIEKKILEEDLLNQNESYETYISGDVLIR